MHSQYTSGYLIVHVGSTRTLPIMWHYSWTYVTEFDGKFTCN